MKKLISFLLVCFQIGLSNAQEVEKCLKIEYIYSCTNNFFSSSIVTNLYINENKAINHRRTSTLKTKSIDENFQFAETSNTYEPYQLIDKDKEIVLFYETIGNNNFLIEDTYIDLKWVVSQESKVIGKYNCIKATTTYRGRTWMVWFTPEIPSSFGPWKLHGLPGLILEAKDEKNIYSFTLSSVTNVETSLFLSDFASLMKTKNKKPISYEKFLDDRAEFSENNFRNMKAKYNVTRPKELMDEQKNNPMGLEIEYEWDKGTNKSE